MTWGLRLHCPEGRTVPSTCMIDPSQCENLVCQAGGICTDPLTRIVCPAGHFCKHGVNASTPCAPGWWGAISPEARCPEGTWFEPSQPEHFIVMLAIVIPFIILLECLSCCEKTRRRATTKQFAERNEEEKSFLQDLPADVRQKVPVDERYNAVRFMLAKTVGREVSKSTRGVLDGLAVPLRRLSSSDRSSAVSREPSVPGTERSTSDVEIAIGESSISGMPLPPPGSPPRLIRKSTKMTTHASLMPLGAIEAESVEGLGDTRMGRALLKLKLDGLSFMIGKAQVLRDINTVMQQGELVALMGESGSGKTTLLNVLGGRASYGLIKGRMSLNKRPFKPDTMSTVVGYVPQAHLVFKELTVYENLAYAALLRLRPSENTQAHRRQLVESALDLLGLQSCRHFVCDPAIGERLSGGEMRRVGIGVELVVDPLIMLLDEPTSALDAVNTRLVVAALKDLASRGVLVLASLHQPRQTAYEMIDRLILLRKGEMIYGGGVVDAPQYFTQLGYAVPQNSNPADFFIEVAFGFESSEKKARDLPDCFGLRYNALYNMLEGLPDLHADRVVRADMLGMLWRQWYVTAVRSTESIMSLLTGRTKGNREFVERLLRLNAKEVRRRRSVFQSTPASPTSDGREEPPDELSGSDHGSPTCSPPGSKPGSRPGSRLGGRSSVTREAQSPGNRPGSRSGSRPGSRPSSRASLGSDLQSSRRAGSASPVRGRRAQGGHVDPMLLSATLDDFIKWFESADGFSGSLNTQVAIETWKKAKKRAEAKIDAGPSRWRRPLDQLKFGVEEDFAGMLPSWNDLRHAMDNMSMPKDEMPSIFVHFYVCFARYAKKLLRTRMRLYALLLILILLGTICGVLHGSPPARNDLVIYYMIFNTLFSCVCATATSATFGGPTDFFNHEAASGVRQSAEGLARIIADILWLVLFAPVFTLTVRTFAVLRAELVMTWTLTAWAMSTFGYIFMLIAPNNANVLTATVVVLVCCLTNGLFGVKPAFLGSMAHVLRFSPGYNSYLLVSLGAVVAEPFDTTRAFLMNLLRVVGLLPSSKAEVYLYETEQFPWRANALFDLFLFGFIGRVIALILFYLRSHYSFEGIFKHIASRVSDMACCACFQDKSQTEAYKATATQRKSLAKEDPDVKRQLSKKQASFSASRNVFSTVDRLSGGQLSGSPGQCSASTPGQRFAIPPGFPPGQRSESPTAATPGSGSKQLQSPVDTQRAWLAANEKGITESDGGDHEEPPQKASTPGLLGRLGKHQSPRDSKMRTPPPRTVPVTRPPGSQDSPLSPVSWAQLSNGGVHAAWLPSR